MIHFYYSKIPSFYFLISFFLMVLVIGSPIKLCGQEYLVLDRINIEGNRLTQEYIIKKELDIREGDTLQIQDMVIRFEENRNRLLNTGLFNLVSINIKNWDMDTKKADLVIELVENWFWYPSPIIELADRSFNAWIYQHKASLKRLNLGIRFMHINLSGNQDKLKLNFHTGFTKKYEIDYTFPYLDANRKIGGYLNLLYVTHKEIAFETRNNQLNFTRENAEPLLTRFRTSLGLKYRQNKQRFHTVYLEYHHKTLADTIWKDINPEYFNNGKGKIDHFSLIYQLFYTNVDKKIYPTNGYRYLIDLHKSGFGIFGDLNHTYVTAAWEQHVRITDYFSTGFKIKARKTVPLGKEIPYSYLTGLGYYDDILSGYQLYVIDGNDFAYLKTFQKFRLVDGEYNLGRFMPLRQFRVFPFKIYMGIHGDIGYVDESRYKNFNAFNARLLIGAGLSLDFILYENYFLSCEFTVNHTGEAGIFFTGINTFE